MYAVTNDPALVGRIETLMAWDTSAEIVAKAIDRVSFADADTYTHVLSVVNGVVLGLELSNTDSTYTVAVDGMIVEHGEQGVEFGNALSLETNIESLVRSVLQTYYLTPKEQS
jgi:hypothetical protein